MNCQVAELNLSQIQEIGMGWYQWQLFIVVGFGWANDNMWPIVTSLICTYLPHYLLLP
jgi:hypothetical protein